MSIPMRIPVGGERRRVATLLEGPSGWGECSPLPGYACDPELARRAAEEAAGGRWPRAVRQRVPVNGLVPDVPPAEAFMLAANLAGEGTTTVKVKVGHGDDAGRVAAVREAMGPTAKLRVDANQAWDIDHATSMLRRLARYDLELAEQPVATLDDLALLRRRVPVPLAADESVRSVDEARRLAHLHAADAVVVKVQPLGGLAAAVAVVEAAGVPAVVSSLLETSVGLAAGLALAAALPELPYACGLGTATLLAGDVVVEPLVPVRGVLELRRPVPEPSLLQKWQA
ncbi:MAG: O-succinylbenzoate synthase [Actinomycetota bacterium]|nr:O-succinylbenzoate synthase [Actinomycetota bacterium]